MSDEELTRDLRQLVQVTKVISSSLQIDDQLPVIMDAVIQLSRADKALLLLFNPKGELEVRAEHPPPADAQKSSKYSTGVIEEVLRSGQAQFILDTDLNKAMKSRQSILSLQLRTVMCAPLRSKTGVIGVLYVHSSTPIRAFNEHKKEVFCALCDHAAIALDNSRLYAASISDPMTGLYNHSYCIRRVGEELDRARRYGRCLTFILADIDSFKQVNDTFGHRRGDAVICAVADAMRLSIRQTDIAARYGGDEFALIVPETGGAGTNQGDVAQNGALILAERLRDNISRVKVEGVAKVTASIGVAIFPNDGMHEGETSDLIERADSAMYAAKKAGRDRVIDASGLPAMRG